MATKRRTVSKLDPARPGAFDEQTWPVNVALVVFAGFVAGVVLVLFRGDQPHLAPWKWVSLIVLLATTGATMWALQHVGNRVVRRGLQFSLVLSLIFHLVLMVVMAVWRPLWMETGEEAELAEQQQTKRPPVVIPEYEVAQFNQLEIPTPVFDRPVETETPDPEREEVRKEVNAPEHREQQQMPSPTTEPTVSDRPSVNRRQEQRESPPRESAQQSRLSRNRTPAQQPATSSAATVANVSAPATSAPTEQLQASAAAAERSPTQATVREPTETVEPITTNAQPQVQAARQSTEQEPVVQNSSTPTLQREVREPLRTPRAAAVAEAQPTAVAKQTAPDQLRPANTAAQKQTTTSAAQSDEQVDVAVSPTAAITPQATRREQTAESSPQMARTPVPVPQRQTRTTSQPGAAAVVAAPQPIESPSRSSSSPLRASSSTVTRQTNSQAPADISQPQPTDVPAASPAPRLARAQPQRAEANDTPTVRPTAPPSDNPSRTTRAAAVAASPVAVASPAVAQSPRAASATLEPTRTALNHGTSGVAGVGTAPNLDRSLPAPIRPATVASASARRERTTQAMAQGPSTTPSEPARISRARASSPTPSAPLLAENAARPTEPGSAQPARIEASSSAAIVRSASNADAADVTAARGTMEVDIGPQRVVAHNSTGRAAGGGQPTLNFDARSNSVTRSSSGGPPMAAIAVAQRADAPQSPQEVGGGQPAAAQISPQSIAMVRTTSGGKLPASGGPSSAVVDRRESVAGDANRVAKAQLGRTEVIDAEPGAAEPGGGTETPARTIAGAPKTAVAAAEVAAVAGDLASAGAPEGTPIDAEGAEAVRSATGVAGPTLGNEFGAAVGDVVVSAVPGQPGSAVGQRNSSAADVAATPIPGAEQVTAPLRRAPTVAAPTDVLAAVDLPELGAPEAGQGSPQQTQLAVGFGADSPSRQETGMLPVDAAAPEGPGGLGLELATDAGSISRRASRDSEDVHVRDVRFIGKSTSGAPPIHSLGAIAAPAFQRRDAFMEGDTPGGGVGRPSPKTEEAIELGLVFLSRHQSANGSWSLHNFAAGKPYQDRIDNHVALHSDTAGTGLTLLAFLGAGYHHMDDKYQASVRKGIDHLVKFQADDGNLFVPEDDNSNRSVALYSHGIATIALCEAYGMTLDERLREPAQKAVDFVAASQHSDRGGWRYRPQVGSDTSVSGWMMMALKSGQLAGLDVSQESFDKIESWLDASQKSERQPYLYSYNPYATDTTEQRHGRQATTTMTSVGLLMRLYTGWRRDNPNMIKGADYLLENLPSRDERDTYYWYYATQVMFHMQGKYWEAWNEALHPMLLETQVNSGPLTGSWHPRLPVRDRWGFHAGRLYVTTMNLISLEVYYRHLPIYEDTAH